MEQRPGTTSQDNTLPSLTTDELFEEEHNSHPLHSSHPFITTAQQVAVYSRRLAKNPAPPIEQAHQYATEATKTVTIQGKEINSFAPFRYQLSAFHTFTRNQKCTIGAFALLLAISLLLFGVTFLHVLLAALMFFYLWDLAFTFTLSIRTLRRSAEEHISDRVVHALANANWPTYTILCPLFHETNILAQFVHALQNLDYPVDKLQVLLLVEEHDYETQSTLAALPIPSHFSLVIVPNGEPRTKPRACNFGLLKATGDYIVIYDAEDVPDPLQLKKAVLTFARQDPSIACIQAKLNFYNARQNLLTRWFAAEYSLWFDLVLPGLQHVGLPLPLGGTSNHFRGETLRMLGAWDPFNMTEDCDLGQRLARYHLKTAILDSTTYEEANSQLKNWIRQRSRWIKGYMQTYLVYMRNPWHYLHPTHWREFLGLQCVIGGKTAVLFLNPLMWLLLALYFLLRPLVGTTYHTLFSPLVLYTGSICLIFGNFFYIYSHIVGCMKRQQYDLVKFTLFIPFYWAMTSIAGFVAFFQLIFKPHYWEKTHHGLHLPHNLSSQEHPTGSQHTASTLPPDAYPITPTTISALPEIDTEPLPYKKLPSLSKTLDTETRSYQKLPLTPAAVSVARTPITKVKTRAFAGATTLKMARHIKHLVIKDPWLLATVLCSCLASIIALVYFFQLGQILTYGDSYSHLLIARRIIDSSNPGLAQIGGVWLPLPHLLMLPFIWIDSLWYTGLAGSFSAMPCYVVSCTYLFLIARRITRHNVASFIGTLLFLVNPNVLYLQTTPLSEMVLIAAMLMACYHFLAWAQHDQLLQLLLAALGTFLSTLARYDGWFLFLALLVLIVIVGLLKQQSRRAIEGHMLTFATLGGLGIVLWFLWCAIIFNDPLYWQRGPYSSQAQQTSLIKLHILYTYHDLWQSLRYFTLDSVANVGLLTFSLGSVACIIYLAQRRFTPERVAALAILAPFLFYVVSLYLGQAALYVPSAVPSTVPNSLYNARYGVQSVAPAAFFAAVLISQLMRPAPFMALIAPLRRIRTSILHNNTYTRRPARFVVSLTHTYPFTHLAHTFTSSRQHNGHASGRILRLIVIPSLFVLLILGQSFFTTGHGIVSLQDGLYGLDCAPQHDTITYLAQHYDGGQLLEDTFTSPVPQIPFKKVIYEGSGPLWTQALKHPAQYVEWVLLNPTQANDLVAQTLQANTATFLAQYKLQLQEARGLSLYRARGLPPLPNHAIAAQLATNHAQCGTKKPPQS